MSIIRFLVIAFLICCCQGIYKQAFGQHAFRFQAEFTIKEKTPDGKAVLTKGKVYYDKNLKKLVYQIRFPERATLLIADTLYFLLQQDSVKEQKSIPSFSEFTLFHQALEGKLTNFGLDDSPYKVTHVEKEGDMVITTWKPERWIKQLNGKIMMSHKAKTLYGIVFFDNEDEVVSKMFFKEYVNLGGFVFPSEIVQINFVDGQEYYKVTTFKAIKIDELGENDRYDFPLPQ